VTGFKAKSIAPLLSPCSGMGLSTLYPSSVRKLWYQAAWLATSVMASVSAAVRARAEPEPSCPGWPG
jgi:hypothetical protein